MSDEKTMRLLREILAIQLFVSRGGHNWLRLSHDRKQGFRQRAHFVAEGLMERAYPVEDADVPGPLSKNQEGGQ